MNERRKNAIRATADPLSRHVDSILLPSRRQIKKILVRLQVGHGLRHGTNAFSKQAKGAVAVSAEKATYHARLVVVIHREAPRTTF